jgi:hypothetical protein
MMWVAEKVTHAWFISCWLLNTSLVALFYKPVSDSHWHPNHWILYLTMFFPDWTFDTRATHLTTACWSTKIIWNTQTQQSSTEQTCHHSAPKNQIPLTQQNAWKWLFQVGGPTKKNGTRVTHLTTSYSSTKIRNTRQINSSRERTCHTLLPKIE